MKGRVSQRLSLQEGGNRPSISDWIVGLAMADRAIMQQQWDKCTGGCTEQHSSPLTLPGASYKLKLQSASLTNSAHACKMGERMECEISDRNS